MPPWQLSLLLLLLPVLQTNSAPNIIIMVADDMGWNDVSWHNPAVITPNLAKLAKDGLKLDMHYSQAICSPARAALLTGRYPIHTGFHNGVIEPKVPYGMDTGFVTLAQELKAANYDTHIVGKWHLGFCREEYWPTNRGFDSFFGFLLGAQTYSSHSRDGGYDFRDGPEVFFQGNGTYSSVLLAERAVRIIEEHHQEKPLFLYLPFQSVHGPLEAPPEYINLYPDIADMERRVYLGMVTAMDAAVGQVTQALHRTGMYEDSVILFFSDNGGPVGGWPPGHDTAYAANNYPLRGGKYTLWEGGTRTVATLTAPRSVQAGGTHSAMLHVTDWFPTLLSAAGLPHPGGLDGRDQWEALRDPALPNPRTELVYNIFYPTWDLTKGPPISAVRAGDWKYIRRTVGFSGWAEAPEQRTGSREDEEEEERRREEGIEDFQDQLFNLSLDPEERENLAEIEPEMVKVLQEKLQQWEENMSDVTYPEPTEASNPENFGGVWSAGWC